MTITVRHPRFDWNGVPPSWLPEHADVATIIDVLHLLLPAGERWFCRVFKDAAPLVEDPVLREQIDLFIRQEAWHAKSHADLLQHYDLDRGSFTHAIDRLFAIGKYVPLKDRVAIVAAIEHYTTVLGHWILQADELVTAGGHPTMIELLRWHGAEEVEHKSVAFDTSKAIGVGYVRRQLAHAFVLAMFVVVWVRGVKYLAKKRRTRPSWRGFFDAGRRGLVPTVGYLVRSVARYPMPGFHP